MKKILFICSSNIGRSQMAEGFYNHFTRTKLASSAGIKDKGQKYNFRPHPDIIKVMKEDGIDVSNQQVRLLTQEMLENADRIISFVKLEELPGYIKSNEALLKKIQIDYIKDPFEKEDHEETRITKFRESREKVKSFVKSLFFKKVKLGNGSRKLCLFTGIHGNESCLFEPLLNHLSNIENSLSDVTVKLILANRLAAEENIREINTDLNRIFGKKTGKRADIYESFLAEELLKETDGMDIILDLHTHSGTEQFCLITKKNLLALKEVPDTLKLLYTIVLAEDYTSNFSLIENVSKSMSIETGQHNSEEAINFAIQCVTDSVNYLNEPNNSQRKEEEKEAPKLKSKILIAKEFIFNNSTDTIQTTAINFKEIGKDTEIYPGFSINYGCIPVLVSKTAFPGKKIFLACVKNDCKINDGRANCKISDSEVNENACTTK